MPFCVSRCSYCSFTSGEIGRMKKYVEPYVDTLAKELRLTLDFARDNGIAIGNVYFGGAFGSAIGKAVG